MATDVARVGSQPSRGIVRILQVDHVQQRYNWDCGLACVGMVLYPEQRRQLLSSLKQIAAEEGFRESTWTIDLAYLLKRFNIPHRYRTITLGVDPSLASEDFYNRILRKDQERVNKRFQRAAEVGVVVEKGSAGLQELLDHLDGKGPLIVLTNGVLLCCYNCGHNQVRHSASMCLPFKMGFEGHYVLVVGYNLRKRRIYYRNPALRDRVCVMSFADFDEARTAHGTDEDVLFIDFNITPHDFSAPPS